ncbi:diacylglycerol kinase family protein [Paenibacillaceae bacterium]|nr:diacylglycerol kinase family protein [Paenibacillaceae bacterium]
MRRFVRNLHFALQGLGFAIRSQRHMQVHLVAAVLVIILAAALRISKVDWLFLIGTCTLVISLELVNTAVEKTVDLAMPQQHPLAKAAKDTAAAAVLVAAVSAVVIGVIILGPPLLERFGY